MEDVPLRELRKKDTVNKKEQREQRTIRCREARSVLEFGMKVRVLQDSGSNPHLCILTGGVWQCGEPSSL